MGSLLHQNDNRPTKSRTLVRDGLSDGQWSLVHRLLEVSKTVNGMMNSAKR